MATKYWNGTAGDWYSGTWSDASGNTTSAPAAGDVVVLENGAVTVSAADVTTYGTFSNFDIWFAGAPSLDLTGETVGAQTTIEAHYSNSSGTVVLRGATSLAGELLGQAGPAAPLTVNLQAVSGTDRLGVTSTGQIVARNSGALAVTGASGATIANAGTIMAGFGSDESGTLSIAVAIDNTGTISTALFGTLSLSGAVTNESAGTIVNSGGTVAITGGLVNAGLVSDATGTMTISGGVSGAGTISIGDSQTLEISGAVAATQTLTFATGIGVVKLDTPASFAGKFSGLTGHDLIDLVGLSAATATVSNGTVTVSNGGSVVTSFTVTGLTATLNSVSDGSGGTILTLEQPGTEAAVVNTMVNGASGTATHNWGTNSPVVTYSFNSSSNWTSTEEAAFINGLALWAAMAKVSFVAAASGTTGNIVFTRGSDQSAYTNWSTSGTLETGATISIDTSVSGWQNLANFGTTDTSGSGGYGWLTVLHEEGHAIGLSHPGNYNETANLATQQTYYTDTRQYAVMSYFDASASGGNWTVSNTDYYAQTPMMFDIAAVQSIYGANTSTLSGGDVFGFNASSQITGSTALNAVYNFSVNTLPIVTLWSGGSNNTLDLSGYSTASSVNLNAGNFSSFDGMTDNLGIAYNTTIDTAVGGSGNDTITVNSDNDHINGGGGTNTVVFADPRADYSIAYNAGTVTVAPVSGITAGTDILTNIQTLQFTDQSDAACFLRGTRIRTERGDIPVEDLRPDEDWAITESGEAGCVAWVGWRRVRLRGHSRPWDVMPVRIRSHAFGPGLPLRDLLLSPDHAVFVGGVLIPVRHLINGATIVQESRDEAVWFHVELDWHAALLAEGLPTESYLDTGNRHAFANGGGATQLDPEFAPRGEAALKIWAARGLAPLVQSGRAVSDLRAALMGRAPALGFAASGDAAAHLRVDGRVVWPARSGSMLEFSLPPRARRAVLVSRAAAPADTDPTSEDCRRLGLAVASLQFDDGDVPPGDPRRGAGWLPPEAEWQWTDGAAELHCAGVRRVRLWVAETGLRYWEAAACDAMAAL